MPDFAPGSRCAVHSYACRNTWIDLRDLTQEASLAALEARRSWRPDGGTSLDLWEAWLVGLALSRFVAERRCPVSLPKRKSASWEAAAASEGVAMEQFRGGSEYREHRELDRVAVEQYEPLDDRIDIERTTRAIRGLMAAQSPAARAVLLGEEKSAAVAGRLGLTRRDVYEQTARAMRALRAALCPQPESAR